MYKPADPATPFGEVYQSFLDNLALEGLKATTIARYRYNIVRFERWLVETGRPVTLASLERTGRASSATPAPPIDGFATSHVSWPLIFRTDARPVMANDVGEIARLECLEKRHTIIPPSSERFRC